MLVMNPRIDIVFKKLFGSEENKDLLKSLINSILSQEDQVEELQILNPYHIKNFQKDPLSIVDVKAQSVCGKRFNIEVQIKDQVYYDKRALYYWARLYTEQLEGRLIYSRLNKAIAIHILNFTTILEREQYHNTFQVVERESGLRWLEDFELHTIELKKFASTQDKLSDLLQKIHSALDRWTLFLSRHDLLDPEALPEKLKYEEIEKAVHVLERMSFNEQERQSYEERLKWMRNEAVALQTAEKKGLKKGMKKGMKRGLEQGLQQGIEKGIQQGIEQGIHSIVIRMLKQGCCFEEIMQCTGLSQKEIQKLKQSSLKE